MLVALHGADETAADAFAAWQSAVDDGFVLLAVESSQRNTPTYRSWPDPEVADRDVARGCRGVVVLGDRDGDVGPDAVASYECLRAAGMQVRMETVPGLGHAIPDDFPSRLQHALTELVLNSR